MVETKWWKEGGWFWRESVEDDGGRCEGDVGGLWECDLETRQ